MLIDTDTLNELQDILGDELRDLYSDFTETTKALMLELRNSIHSHDIERTIKLSHTIKGSAGNIGLTMIYNESMLIESAARQNLPINLKKSYSDLDTALKHTIEELIKLKLL